MKHPVKIYFEHNKFINELNPVALNTILKSIINGSRMRYRIISNNYKVIYPDFSLKGFEHKSVYFLNGKLSYNKFKPSAKNMNERLIEEFMENEDNYFKRLIRDI